MSELKENKEIANSGKQTDSVQSKCLQIPPRWQHMWTTSTIVFSCSKCVLALRPAHSLNARRDHQDRCSTRRWCRPKHRARHSCTTCCDTSSERWSTGGPGGMEILGPASRTDLTDAQYGSVARALELQLRGRDGGSNGTVRPRHRPLRESERRDVPRNIRVGVALRMLPDGPLKQHLVLNSTQLTTWVILKAETDNVRRAQAV